VRSIRLRLAAAGSVLVCLVIGALTVVGLAVAERRLEEDLRQEAGLTAIAVADDLELRSDPIESPATMTMLREFLNAGASVREITLFTAADGSPRPVMATSPDAGAVADDLVVRALQEMRTVSEDRSGPLIAVATPILREGDVAGAVLVTASLVPVFRLRNEGRLFAAGIAGLAIIGISVVMYVLLAGLERQHALLREELWRARELATVGQTMANVAHQLGTPLNLASAHVQLLQQEVPHDAQVQRRLGIIHEQIDRVTDSLRALLDRVRARADGRAFAVRPVLGRLVEAGQVLAGAQGVRVTLDAPDALPLVVGDETQFELALTNLVTNALDAMPDGGTVAVAASHEPGRVTIDVTDTGAGIAPEILERVFEPWVTTKPVGRGTGLGLSIARDVFERMGGTIAAAARDGGGTVMRVTLPPALREQTEAEGPASESTA
jgi:signal transduction histidine kinase